MKTIISIAFIGLCCLNSLNAQDSIQTKDNNQKIKIFRIWVSLKSDPYKIKGVLYEVKDSSVFVSNSLVIQDYSVDKYEVTKLHIADIETIKIRRKNRIGNGVLIGSLTGFVVGGIVGLVDGDDPPGTLLRLDAEDKAIMMGVPLAVIGAGIGALFGSSKITIPINGSMDNYNRNKEKLRTYSINKN